MEVDVEDDKNDWDFGFTEVDMVGDSLDLLDAFDAEVRFRLNVLQSIVRNDAQFVHRLAG